MFVPHLFVCDLIRLLSCRETKLEAATLVHLRRQEARELEDDKRRLTQAQADIQARTARAYAD